MAAEILPTAAELGLTEGRTLPKGCTVYQLPQDPTEREQFLPVMYQATADGFGRDNDDHNKEDVRNHVLHAPDVDMIADKDGNLIGFGAGADLGNGT